MFRRAEVLRGEGELAEAHKLAKRGAAVFPDSVGGKECKNLINQIESKSSSVSIERIWNAPLPKIQLLLEPDQGLLPDHSLRLGKPDETVPSHPELVDHRRKGEWLNKQPLKEWSVDLAPTDDFKERVEKIDVPKDLEPGSYFLFASHDPKFGEQENRVSYSSFWVSDLSLVMRKYNHGSGALEGFVLNAITGEPVQGATVRSWKAERNNRQVELKATRTDANGLFSIKAGRTNLTVLASHQGQSLSTANSYYVNDHNSQRRPYERSVFFTDRSLYRPGQTIRYKGVSYRIDQENDNYKVIPNRDLTVVFRDRNNQEIARLKHRTNDYGSFDGSFTAPRDRLMGRIIQIEREFPGRFRLGYRRGVQASQVPGNGGRPRRAGRAQRQGQGSWVGHGLYRGLHQ